MFKHCRCSNIADVQTLQMFKNCKYSNFVSGFSGCLNASMRKSSSFSLQSRRGSSRQTSAPERVHVWIVFCLFYVVQIYWILTGSLLIGSLHFFIIPFFTLFWSIWQAPKLSQHVYTWLIFKPVCLTSTSSLAHISLASMTSESKMFLPSFELVSMKMALCKRGGVKMVVVKGISSNFQWVCLGWKVATCTREPSFHHPLHQHTFNMSFLAIFFTFGKKTFREKKLE